MGAAEAVLAAMLSLAPYHADADEGDSARAALLAPVASAIVEATGDRTERAFLVAQAWHETKYARYVLEDRCADGPVGARCDGGRATGPWQVHRWCSAAWTGTPAERYIGGARCALRMWRHGLARCKGARAGGFAAQSGGIAGRCDNHRWSRRVRTMTTVIRTM